MSSSRKTLLHLTDAMTRLQICTFATHTDSQANGLTDSPEDRIRRESLAAGLVGLEAWLASWLAAALQRRHLRTRILDHNIISISPTRPDSGPAVQCVPCITSSIRTDS